MKVRNTVLTGVVVIEPDVYGDERGCFLQTFHEKRYAEIGINYPFVQDNHSRSKKGVLRGLHYQLVRPQGQLMSVVRGEIFDVAVDVRKGSETFGQWVGEVLNDVNHKQLFIPPGFAHGFCVLSDEVDMIYRCTDYYHPESEKTILWNDPELNIQWPIGNDVILSEKDRLAPCLSEMDSLDFPSLLVGVDTK